LEERERLIVAAESVPKAQLPGKLPEFGQGLQTALLMIAADETTRSNESPLDDPVRALTGRAQAA
jgi:hypothetical protein